MAGITGPCDQDHSPGAGQRHALPCDRNHRL